MTGGHTDVILTMEPAGGTPPDITCSDGMPSLLQQPAYGAAKAAGGGWRVERGTFYEDEHSVGMYQALIRDLPAIGGGLVWINRGPRWRGADDDTSSRIGQILSLIRDRYLPAGYYVRVAPGWPVDAVPDSAVQQAGFRATGTPGWASSIIDLTLPPQELRANLHQKWRNTLNKAESGDLGVDHAADSAALDEFVAAHQRDLDARGYPTGLDGPFIRSLHAALAESKGLEFLFARQSDGCAVGAIAIAKYGETAEYLAGHNDPSGRRAGAGQLLLWRALLAMREAGYARFDLGGMDPEMTPAGIYRFKERMGGVHYRLANEIEALGGGLRAGLVRWRVGIEQSRARPTQD